MFCWFYRWRISNALNNTSNLPVSVAAHIKTCQRCDEFYRQCISLGARLSVEADKEQPQLFSQTIEKILTALPHSGKQTAIIRFRWHLAAVAACIVLTFVVWISVSSIQKYRQAVEYGVAVQELKNALVDGGLISSQPSQADKTQRWQNVIESPIAGEMEGLSKQARSAVSFLFTCVDVRVVDQKKSNINN